MWNVINKFWICINSNPCSNISLITLFDMHMSFEFCAHISKCDWKPLLQWFLLNIKLLQNSVPYNYFIKLKILYIRTWEKLSRNEVSLICHQMLMRLQSEGLPHLQVQDDSLPTGCSTRLSIRMSICGLSNLKILR